MALLDHDNLRELSECVERLSHSGQKILDPVLTKRMKGICRLSEKYIDHAYHLIIHQLNKEHAEIRYSAFQICNELFRRSHHFRELVVNDMQHLIEVTAETSPDNPLPPPRSVALDLKRLALGTIEDWNKEFGKGYKKLQIGFNFLKHCKKVDFNALNNESLAQQARTQERERRQNVVNQSNLIKVTVEFDEMLQEICDTITSMQNCLSLLMPMPENFFIPDSSSMSSNKPVSKTKLREVSPSPTATSTSACKTEPNIHTLSPNYKKEDSDSDSDAEEMNLRENGMLNARHTVSVNLDFNVAILKRTADNEPICENARDLFILLHNRYLPQVKKWVKTISKASEFAAPGQLMKVMFLKEKLETAINKCAQLKLQQLTQGDESSSSDSEFEEVKDNEGYEKCVMEELPILKSALKDEPGTSADNSTKNKRNWSIWSQENKKEDPTTPQSTLAALTANAVPPTTLIKAENHCKKKRRAIGEHNDAGSSTFECELEPRPSTSKDTGNCRKTKLLTVAPKLPFDVDLYHWEDEKLPIPTMLAVRAEGSQIWSARPSEGLDEIPVPEDMASSLRTRVIEFSGKFQPVKKACRAALPNGKLCPRKDRLKCPFHGKIVPRDETGQCTNPEDARKLRQLAEEEQIRNPDWQDPQLLAEIKAATGVDLKMPEKGKHKKKKKPKVTYPGLTDLKAKQNTSHSRLAKKVFKKSTMNRISKTLDTQDHKRFRDKYGDQFHYMHNTA